MQKIASNISPPISCESRVVACWQLKRRRAVFRPADRPQLDLVHAARATA